MYRFEVAGIIPASWDPASEKALSNGASRAARTGFERAFWAKTKRKKFIHEGAKNFHPISKISFLNASKTKI
ncbi:hypothetical protein A3A38_03235 [Candidatus Kaiserbacteria bacterium RIFCSPLOWO2_01_FULL_53_17]|uniref:Uncharacterized protein n=1 Tax=Candidatus Kaiserbacteria bacterium RIFCSPLOWO2_01_FULL_53_17 TaxID=1798511 RepID=A0A1F6EH50_9BACT|nr:MAG: hypothetical protein A3A38_03235 [Candidatus Kaiserbacteria bacterium RIFCSPLOWO2_01_FULL_53_17]